MSEINKHTSGAVDSVVDGLAKRQDDLLSDFKIKCRGREWKVHKVILATHSPVLAVAVTKDFRELGQGFIDLSTEERPCIEMLLSYLYNLDYQQDVAFDLDDHVKMCILADKYDIPPLKVLAIEYFKQAATEEAIYDDQSNSFCEAIRCAWDAPEVTKEIRSHVVEVMVETDAMGVISKNPGSALDKVVREHADVAIDIAMALRARSSSGESNVQGEKRVYYRCDTCGDLYPEIEVHGCPGRW